tara:strand:+ start:1352 stop:2074 length:723 start_codon:yes stop_codon:yes gene_type:complete
MKDCQKIKMGDRRLKKAILALLMILIISCDEKENKEIIEVQTTNEVINYLALGDSYTIGQGVEEFQRWPIQLGEKIEELNYDVDEIKIIARTGWTTSNLLQAIENTEIGKFNLVSLSIGVNNQFQNQSFTKFETEFDILLNKSIEFAGDINNVFVVSIPDYGVTPFGRSNSESIGKEIDRYNEYISVQCEEKGIPFINITEVSRELGDSEGALASDNLHPSGSQYAQWTDIIVRTVIELL